MHRAGGDGATPGAVRAVLERDGAMRHPDPWQWWFTEATGLAVLVSTESVVLVTRPHGPAGPPKVLKAEFPPVVRRAVRRAADAPAPPPEEPTVPPGEARTGDRVRVPCPACGRGRVVTHLGPAKFRLTLGQACNRCARAVQWARRKGAA